jgi:hypothetical protein
MSVAYTTCAGIHCGNVLVRSGATSGVEFFLVIKKENGCLLVRDVNSGEFWAQWRTFAQQITQGEAEALGARWRVAPQERPGLTGPARHAPKPKTV